MCIRAVTSKMRSRHAKDCTISLRQSLEVETNLSLQSNKSDKGAINSLKALKNMHIDLTLLQDGDTILLPQRIRLHLRHHDGNCGFLPHFCGVHPDVECRLFGRALDGQQLLVVEARVTRHTLAQLTLR